MAAIVGCLLDGMQRVLEENRATGLKVSDVMDLPRLHRYGVTDLESPQGQSLMEKVNKPGLGFLH